MNGGQLPYGYQFFYRRWKLTLIDVFSWNGFLVQITRLMLPATQESAQLAAGAHGEYRYTRAWIKVGGRWQVLANQATPIAK